MPKVKLPKLKLSRLNPKLAILLVLAVAAGAALGVYFTRGDQKLPPPVEYVIGEERVKALEVDAETEYSVEGLEEEEEKDEEEGEEAPEEPAPPADITYSYEVLTVPNEKVQAYVESLTTGVPEEEAFVVVDDTFFEADAPDYTATEGSVLLARPATQEGSLFTLLLAWGEETCDVVLSLPEGEISYPPTEGLTTVEALDYLTGLSPSLLELEGTSMQEYEIYMLSGAVLVDGHPCMRLEVCKDTGFDTNEVVGVYLMTADGTRIYRLAPGGESVKELPVPKKG